MSAAQAGTAAKRRTAVKKSFIFESPVNELSFRAVYRMKIDCASVNLKVSGAREFPEVIVPFSVMLSRGAVAGTLTLRNIVIESPDFRFVNWIGVVGLTSVAWPAPPSV